MMPPSGGAGQQDTSPVPARRAVPLGGADIVPDPENGVLRVRILGTASDAATARLLGEFNETRTVFPRTGLRMVYELPESARTTGQEASRSWQ